METFLRLLYSPTLASGLRLAAEHGGDGLDPDTRSILDTLDFERLAFFQRSRVSQLHVHFRRQFGALVATAPAPMLESIIAGFADSPRFWEPRGRSLGENFALFAYERFTAQERPDLADLVRLQGIVSGMSARPTADSPWPDRRPPPAVALGLHAIALDCFHTRSRLLDERGAVLSGDQFLQDNAAVDGMSEVFVAYFSDRSAVVGSVPVEVQS
ncbi:MAG: hypothetical protein K0V04_38085 [Deltaproteobacteria bacterium]|nr:hypothetical protein [Deltaproteobacteria bacterium]